MRRNLNLAFFGGVSLTVGLLMTGCAAEPANTSSQSTPTQTGASVAKQTSAKTPTPTPSATNDPLSAVPMDKSCEDIFPLDSLYEFDANLGLIPGQSPTVSSESSEQIALGGISCVLTNLSSGATTEVVVAKLSDKSATTKKKQLDALSAQGNYQVETGLTAAFSGKTGEFVKNNYWVSIASNNFSNPLDASRLSYLSAQGLKE